MTKELFSRKAIAVCVLCSGFFASYPLTAAAADSQTKVEQQKVTVTGVVTDATGEPIIGASVVEKGTTNGTITDFDGKFSVQVSKSGVTLVISYVGYTPQEVVAKANQELQITLLEDNELLDEVVVVGYGVQKKSDVTGSVTSVNKERLEKLPVTNVLQAIQGATAGVNISQISSIPGDAPSALIRGTNSINASTGPYIVVDGVPINKTGGSLNDIAPSDIESMEILKDASATAIYGTNGSNGVILITTKHGKTGKPAVKYSGYFGLEDFSHRLKFCDGEQIIQRYKDYVAINPGETMWNENVKYEAEEENYNLGKTTDWVYDMASQIGTIQNHNISINGGADRIKYYVSADYLDQKGVLKGYNYTRYSIRTNIDATVTDYLTIGTNSYIASHNNDGGRVNFLYAEASSPWAKVYKEDGKTYEPYHMWSESMFMNPMIYTTREAERRKWNISLNGYAEIDFGKMMKVLNGLKYKLNAGYSFAPKRENTYSGEAANDLNGTGYIFNSDTQTYTIENIVSYAKDIQKHHIDVTLLYAASRKKYSESSAKGQKFINDDLSFNNLGSGESATVGSYADLYTTVSQMGRVNYSWDSRYLFTFTVRRDGSSVFGADNKYGVFPSVALGWNVTRESFMENTKDWLNNLRMRLSLGKTGNEAIGVYQTLVKMNNGSFAMGGNKVTGLYPSSRMGNNKLSWEETSTVNLGFDFGFWENRLSGNLDMYVSETTDMLMKRNLPSISGYSDVYANMGKLGNKGIELTLNSKNIVTKDFSWSSGLVFSTNKNEIKELYGDGKDDIGNRWFIGHPIGVIYDYDMIGIWQEDEIAAGLHKQSDPIAEAGDVKLADRNGDGVINDEDRHIKGQTSPKWTAGLTNTFTYKNFTLSVFIQTVQGRMNWNRLEGIAGDEMGRRNTTSEIGYWTPENKSNKWRSLRKNSNKHGYGFAEKADYTRIKDVTLSYDFPENIVKKLHLAALNVYASGRNLFTFTDWIGWDPEARQDPRGSGEWEDNYPMTKNYVIGLNVTF